MRSGVAAWAERTSVAFRRELDVFIDEALPPQNVADYLDIKIITPAEVPGITDDVLEQILENDPWGWSGVGIQIEGKGVVIYNPKKSGWMSNT